MAQYYIWCFPGTGKSSVSQSVPDVLDADSRLFQFIGATPQMLHNTAARARTAPNPEYPDNYFIWSRCPAPRTLIGVRSIGAKAGNHFHFQNLREQGKSSALFFKEKFLGNIVFQAYINYRGLIFSVEEHVS